MNGFTYQWPKTGSNYVLGTFFCPPPSCAPDANRMYFRNRLRKTLEPAKTYCVKFYVNVSNNSTYGIDGFGAYFGDSSLDTIIKTGVPLIYLAPQIQNPSNNLVTDTLTWTLITGTFVANGTEKFMVIGNFKSDANTNKTLIDSTNLPAIATDVCVDDVSCIEMNLPAYAGRDTVVLPGSSVFIGREPDFATDSGCIWYKLPNMATPIATVSGLFVNPTSTSTYIVKQTLDCSPEKWDTVVVTVDPTVGFINSSLADNDVIVFPNPAKDFILITLNQKKLNSWKLRIYNPLGQFVLEKNIIFKKDPEQLNIEDLPEGIYILRFTNEQGKQILKKIHISR